MIEVVPFLSLLAQSAPPSAPSGGNPMIQMLPIVLLFVGMWFLIIAPQRKKQKAHDKMVSDLQRGDQVITTGGIYGEITGVKTDRFVLKIADGTRVELAKNFVQTKIASGSGDSSGKDE